MLRCRDGSLYTGAAKDLVRRLAQHTAGRASKYTRSRLPVTLVHVRSVHTWSRALSEEFRLKQLTRAAKERLVSAAPSAPEVPSSELGFGALIPATFVARPNRFLIHADADVGRVEAACADPGRLRELLQPGVALRLAPATGKGRRTAYGAALARQGRTWVSLVPALANRLFEAAVAAGKAPGLHGARILAREVRRGASRFDFEMHHRGRTILVEVKSVGLVQAGRGLFPDAPTARGARHLRELAEHARGGGAALVVFVVQRDDARSVSPYAEMDPDFAQALAGAAQAGVRLMAFGCKVSPRSIAIVRRLPLRLP